MMTLLAAAAMSSFLNVQVVKVHDGDTFTVNIPDVQPVFGRKLPVRIQGINAPEIYDARKCVRDAGVSSRDQLIGMLLKGKVDLTECRRDKYFRILCRVTVDQIDVGETMLFMRLALPYDGGVKAVWPCPQE